MAIVNQRWPRELAPTTCDFGASRNDVVQTSPATRSSLVIERGRTLWTAKLSWSKPNGRELARLRFMLYALKGRQGSVQLWDFGAPVPEELAAGSLGATVAGAGSLNEWANASARPLWGFNGAGQHWQGGSSVPLSAMVPASSALIPLSGFTAGEVVCFQGQYVQVGRRLYLASETAIADASGAATVAIEPGLIQSAPAGTEVRLTEAGCEMELVDLDWSSSARARDGFRSISANFRETVEDKQA